MEKEKIIFQKNVCRPRLEENYVKNPNIEEQARKKKKERQRRDDLETRRQQ